MPAGSCASKAFIGGLGASSEEAATALPLWVICNAKWTEFEGRPVVLAGIVDVTRRREREQHFRFLIENHPSPVSLSDVETGEIIYESPAGARLFGREWMAEATDPGLHGLCPSRRAR